MGILFPCLNLELWDLFLGTPKKRGGLALEKHLMGHGVDPWRMFLICIYLEVPGNLDEESFTEVLGRRQDGFGL